jgi:phosphoglycolate phosphatase
VPVFAALFDFDGTLADSFAAITASTNFVRGEYGLPALTEAEVKGYVGFGLEHLLRQLVPPADPGDAVRAYRVHHETVARAMTTLLPGVGETTAELLRRRYKLAVCSNKAVRFTKELVAHLFPAGTFAEVLGPEHVIAPKPNPAMLLEGCRRLKVSEKNAVYVGDMSVDVEAARRAGLPVWLVPGGAAGTDAAAAAGPDRVLTSFAEILDLLPPIG